MHRQTTRRRAALVLTLVGSLSPAIALAQAPFGAGVIAGAIPVSAERVPQDAPARVGRLARITGTVSYHPEGADRWEPALLNLPVSDGAAFWTEPGAEADIDIASGRIVMDGGTELDIDAITALAVNATLPQGHIYVRLQGLAAGESLTILTPRGNVAMRADGRYAVSAGDTENPTRITVLEGAAQVSGPNVNLELGAGQTGTIEGLHDFVARVAGNETGVGRDNVFLMAQAARDQPVTPPQAPTALPAAPIAPMAAPMAAPAPRSAPAVQPPPTIRTMPGGNELGAHGTWANTRAYGRVWYPRVAANWRPYRDGKWMWVRPWGWTWVDAAPWGFAPSHYGRWVTAGGRWAWSPGAAARPIFAPAPVENGIKRPNIVLPPPSTRDAAIRQPPAPGPILFRPLPDAPLGRVPLRPAIPSRMPGG